MNPHADESHPLSVILHRQWRQHGQWRYPQWQVSGLLAQHAVMAGETPTYHCVQSEDDGESYLWSGLALDFFRDSLQSYYQNLTGAQPSLFVLCHDDHPQTGMAPVSISADWADAEAHMETDGIVLSAALAVPFTNWLADYVLRNQALLDRQIRQNSQGKHGKGKGKRQHV